MKSLRDMQVEVTVNNLQKGWFDKDRTFGDGIALLHSEVSEALEAYRDYDFTDVVRFEWPSGGYAILQSDDVNAVAWLKSGTIPKPLSVGSEYADILIRLLDECERHGIDLEVEYERKMAYNRTRPVRHGGKQL